MFGEKRFRDQSLQRVSYGMCHFSDWDEMCEKFSDHLPSFFGMVDYLIRQTFLLLFGSQGSRVYRWYHRSMGVSNRMTETVIDYLVTCKKKTMEQRVMLSCLFRAHSTVELKVLLAKHPEVLEELYSEVAEGDGGLQANGDGPRNVVPGISVRTGGGSGIVGTEREEILVSTTDTNFTNIISAWRRRWRRNLQER